MTKDQAPLELADAKPTETPSTKRSIDESASAWPVNRGDVIDVKLSTFELPESNRSVKSREFGAEEALSSKSLIFK